MSGLQRRVFSMALAFMVVCVAQSAQAQSIRYFVRQSTGLFEISGNTGGRFVVAPTGEWIHIRDVGWLPVRGRTDRAARGETVYARGQGNGSASLSVVRSDERGRVYQVFRKQVQLPDNSPAIVIPHDPNWDYLTAVVSTGIPGGTASRRIPIGTR